MDIEILKGKTEMLKMKNSTKQIKTQCKDSPVNSPKQRAIGEGGQG